MFIFFLLFVSIGNCDFEKFETDCKWLNEKGDNFDWTIHSGRTPSSGTGPSFDHTKGRCEFTCNLFSNSCS